MQIADQLPRVVLAVHQVRLEPALKQMPAAPMAPVEADAVGGLKGAAQLVSSGQRRIR